MPGSPEKKVIRFPRKSGTNPEEEAAKLKQAEEEKNLLAMLRERIHAVLRQDLETQQGEDGEPRTPTEEQKARIDSYLKLTPRDELLTLARMPVKDALRLYDNVVSAALTNIEYVPVEIESKAKRQKKKANEKKPEKAKRKKEEKQQPQERISTVPEEVLMEIANKPVEEWTEEDKALILRNQQEQAAAIAAYQQKEQEVFGPMIASLRDALERAKRGDVVSMNPETIKLLDQMNEIRDSLSSVPKEHKERWLLAVAQKIGASKVPYARDRLSKTSASVAEAIQAAQIELEGKGMPLPQEISLFDKSKPIMEVAAIAGAVITKGSVSVVEGGTLATFLLLLRQELEGHHFALGSPEHVITTAVIIALTAPFIEAGASALVSDPIQRKESVKKSVKRLVNRGALALVLAGGLTAVSSAIQTQTVANALANTTESGKLGEKASEGRQSIERQVAGLTPLSQRVINATSDAENEVIDIEITGRQVAGRGGTGQDRLGPAAAFKIGFLLGEWDQEHADRYEVMPASTLDDFERGRTTRQALVTEVKTQLEESLTELQKQAETNRSEQLRTDIKTLEDQIAHLDTASVSEMVGFLSEDFERDTRDERQQIKDRFAELGTTADTIDFWMKNPGLVKLVLAIGYTPPGQAIVDDRIQAALQPILALQTRHQEYTADVNRLLGMTSELLTSSGGGNEGAVSITAESFTFNTSKMNIEVENAISLSSLNIPYEVVAEEYTGGKDMVRVISTALLLYSLMNFVLFGIKAGLAWANAKRYQRLQGAAEHQYEYTTKNEQGYLDGFSKLMSEKLSKIFGENGGVLADPVMREQLQLMTDRQWISLTPEMVRVATLEIVSELEPVKSTGKEHMLEGLLHMYQEAVQNVASRGTPPEVHAMNAVTKLLRDHPELSTRLVQKLFPGFYELESFLDERTVDDTPLTQKDIRTLDSKLYPVIVGNLERQLKIAETKRAWCRDAFEKFRKKGILPVSAGALEELDDAPVDLKEAGYFDETGLNPQKLAGSAVRRATIRTLTRHIQEANDAIAEVRLVTTDLNEAVNRKSILQGNLSDASTYRAIDGLLKRLDSVDAYKEVADPELAGATPRGSIENAIEDRVIEEIHDEMGILAVEDSREDFATLHRRVAGQFDALTKAAKDLWSWEKIKGDAPHKDALTNAYRQQAEFRVIPATEDTPAPSYGIEFKVVHKETGDDVVSFHYSLARTFSENQSPEEIRKYFLDQLRIRGLHSVSLIYLDRAERAFEKQSQYSSDVQARPIDLNGKSVGSDIDTFFGDVRFRKSAYTHLRRLRNTAESLKAQLDKNALTSATESEDDATLDEGARITRVGTTAYKEISNEAERFEVPLVAVRISQPQLEKIASDLQNIRGVRMVFDQEADVMHIATSGTLGLGAKRVDVPLTEFKRILDDSSQNLIRTLNVILPRTRIRTREPR